jgi:hypothetical protein
MKLAMRPVVVAVALFLFLPSTAMAQTQASIAGVARDSSGAVLPGVTVEAASPSLIEKVRATVTDDRGQYRIEALVPGIYSVTFTLPGFSTVRRVGIELAGSFSAQVHADMAVGVVEETITVSGESPVVDVQNTVQQRVIDRQVIDTIPLSSNVFNMAGATVPGLSSQQPDVGGVNPGRTTAVPALSIHGSSNNDQQLFQNGIQMMSAARTSYGLGGGQNNAGTQEVTLDTSAGSAEAATGGVRVNFIPRDGGNIFAGVMYVRFTNHSLQSSNFTDDLKSRGLSTPNSIKTNWEVNPGFGGPIRQDKLWFFASARYTKDEGYIAGMFYNKNANNPNAWAYEPDPNRPAISGSAQPEEKLRLSWQAAPKHKIGLTWQEQKDNPCPSDVTATSSPEAGTCRPQPVIRVAQTEWTSPITNRVLLEGGFLFSRVQSNQLPPDGHNPLMISVTEQSTGLRFRSFEQFRRQLVNSYNFRVSASYITGTHATKIGVMHRSGNVDYYAFDFQPLSYRFNNGVPNRITQRALPAQYYGTIDHDLGIYAQDKWTHRQLTVSYGLRFDYFANSFPEVHITPAALAPTRDYVVPHQDNIAWKDVTPKFGVTYDLFGNGKTALKASANKYLQNGGGGFGTDTTILGGGQASNTIITNTTRSWNDANRNYVPDCDLINTAANGECGAMANANFGKAVPSRVYDPAIMEGWGARGHNWEFSAGVQHELAPRVALDFGYFRRVFGNLIVTDDRAIGPADFDPFSITAPADSRLPGGGGYTVSGLYDLKPARFGVPADLFVTRSSNYGDQISHWNGFDLTVNARLDQGVLLRGGMSTGHASTDNCEIVAKLDNPSPLYCHSENAFQTEVKFLASYTVPRVDVLLSTVFQNLQGVPLAANYNAPNAQVAPSLGRSLSGGAANATVNLVAPGTMFGDRVNQVDLRIAKLLRYAGDRIMLNVDIFNALNANPVLTENSSFAVWRTPTDILTARFVRFSVQYDF